MLSSKKAKIRTPVYSLTRRVTPTGLLLPRDLSCSDTIIIFPPGVFRVDAPETSVRLLKSIESQSAVVEFSPNTLALVELLLASLGDRPLTALFDSVLRDDVSLYLSSRASFVFPLLLSRGQKNVFYHIWGQIQTHLMCQASILFSQGISAALKKLNFSAEEAISFVGWVDMLPKLCGNRPSDSLIEKFVQSIKNIKVVQNRRDLADRVGNLYRNYLLCLPLKPGIEVDITQEKINFRQEVYAEIGADTRYTLAEEAFLLSVRYAPDRGLHRISDIELKLWENLVAVAGLREASIMFDNAIGAER